MLTSTICSIFSTRVEEEVPFFVPSRVRYTAKFSFCHQEARALYSEAAGLQFGLDGQNLRSVFLTSLDIVYHPAGEEFRLTLDLGQDPDRELLNALKDRNVETIEIQQGSGLPAKIIFWTSQGLASCFPGETDIETYLNEGLWKENTELRIK